MALGGQGCFARGLKSEHRGPAQPFQPAADHNCCCRRAFVVAGAAVAMQVRGADPDDLEWLCHATTAMAWESEGRRLDTDTVRAGVAAGLSDDRARYFVADDDGPVGSLFVTREWSDWSNAWYWWIQGVYVEPARRRTGVYRALHEAVMAAARQAGAASVRLYAATDNDTARATYEALGMQRHDYVLYDCTP